MQNATAIAQAADALEQAATATKRDIGNKRKLLQTIRQAQAGLADAGLLLPEARIRALGIEIETHSPGGIVDGDHRPQDEAR